MPITPLAGEDFIDTVDDFVAHLRKDPTLIEEVMGGGNTPRLEGILHQKSELAHFPVFVVYTVTPRCMAPVRTGRPWPTPVKR